MKTTMMKTMRKPARVMVTGLVAWAVAAASLDGQQRRMAVQGHGGLAIPTGRLADITDAGPSVGVQMSFPMSSRWAVTVNGDLDQLGGARLATVRAPDMRMYRYGVGLQRSLLTQAERRPPPGRRGGAQARPARWSLLGEVGFGAASFASKPFVTSAGSRDFDRTYLETNAGLRVNYDWTPRLRLFAATRGSLSFADEGDTAVLAALDPRAQARAFGSSVTLPVSAGFTLRM